MLVTSFDYLYSGIVILKLLKNCLWQIPLRSLGFMQMLKLVISLEPPKTFGCNWWSYSHRHQREEQVSAEKTSSQE